MSNSYVNATPAAIKQTDIRGIYIYNVYIYMRVQSIR